MKAALDSDKHGQGLASVSQPYFYPRKIVREQEINKIPVMAQLFFLVKVLEKLSIAGLRLFFQVLLEGKRTSQNG
jgi:hypothetical protein